MFFIIIANKDIYTHAFSFDTCLNYWTSCCILVIVSSLLLLKLNRYFQFVKILENSHKHSVTRRYSIIKVLWSFANFTGKRLCRSVFLLNFIKKRSFPVEFAKLLRSTISVFYRTPRETACEKLMSKPRVHINDLKITVNGFKIYSIY